jgi:hypothetical protein
MRSAVLEVAARARAATLRELDPDGGVPLKSYGRVGRAGALAVVGACVGSIAAALHVNAENVFIGRISLLSATPVLYLPSILLLVASPALIVTRRRMRRSDAMGAAILCSMVIGLALLAGLTAGLLWRPVLIGALAAFRGLGPLGAVHISTLWILGRSLLSSLFAAETIVLAGLVVVYTSRGGQEMIKILRLRHQHIRDHSNF